MINAGLYLISTPIGNADDITLRALNCLKEVDCLLCEDTRVTGLLLQHHSIEATLVPYHEHNAQAQRPKIIDWIKEGKSVGLVSDAGTPLISDPGYKLAKEIKDEGFKVEALPGPCAAITALTLSGLPTDRFYFYGFLPQKTAARKKALEEAADISGSVIFYENKNRVLETLADIQSVWGECTVSLARELTKEHQEVISLSVSELIEQLKSKAPKGEIILIVDRPPGKIKNEEQVDPLIKKYLNKHPVKTVVQMVSEETGVSKNKVYERALKLKEQVR